MSRLSPRERIWIVTTLVLALLPLVLGAGYVWRKHQWAQGELDRIAPRYARLLGLEQHGREIDARLGAIRERLVQYVYPVEMDGTRVGNDAQQRVRSVLSTAGLTVVSSQVLPTKAEKEFERISLSVRVEGELIHLQSALAVIPSLNPVVLIDSINVQIVGVQRADRPQRLAVQLNLTVLHAKPV